MRNNAPQIEVFIMPCHQSLIQWRIVMSFRFFVSQLLVGLILLGISFDVKAQGTTGTIVGTVSDTTGAVIPKKLFEKLSFG